MKTHLTVLRASPSLCSAAVRAAVLTGPLAIGRGPSTASPPELRQHSPRRFQASVLDFLAAVALDVIDHARCEGPGTSAAA